MTLLYQGVRKVTRKSWVGTGPDGQGGVAETEVSTVELYDLQGRLYKVIEPEGLTAEYTYDTEDRLTRARLFGPTAQVRSFSYDPRGPGIEVDIEVRETYATARATWSRSGSARATATITTASAGSPARPRAQLCNLRNPCPFPVFRPIPRPRLRVPMSPRQPSKHPP